MIVSIHQPNLFPWVGYFLKIIRSDVFVFLDNVQITKTGSSFTNRVGLCIGGKSQWFTVPIKREKSLQNVNETSFVNEQWRTKLINTLQMNYSSAQYYKENIDFVKFVLEYQTENLSEFNINAISEFCRYLNVNTKLVVSSNFNVTTTSTQRLIDILKELNATTYLSGTGADKYQNIEMYEANNIKLVYNEFNMPIYNQLNSPDFIPGLSIIDVLFCMGRNQLIENLHQQKSI